MAKAWKPFPHDDASYVYTPATLKKHWPRLHRGDQEPLPKSAAVVDAWIAFHAGQFQRAVQLGLAAGAAGLVAANKAQLIHATYLESADKAKGELFSEVVRRCEAQQAAEPDNPNAWYLHAAALGRYAQSVSVARALAEGAGGKVRASLTRALALAPDHPDAHIALGAYHAEVIDKVGAMVGGLTYGAKKDEGLRLLERSLALNPDSAIARIEFANALAMLEGKKALPRAEKLYAEAAACKPMDAMERLDVELAKAEIDD